MFYGSLMAAPLIVLILTGNRENEEALLPLRKKATLRGYRRVNVLGKDYPALVKGLENDLV